jgi:hypothetical protein
VSFLDDAFTFCEARSGGHMLVYFIPATEQTLDLAVDGLIGFGMSARASRSSTDS